MNKNKGYTLWFTGLSGSGKTTIATGVVKILREKNIPVVLLDGDIVRKALSPDLGFTKKDRDEQVRRIANICQLITSSKILNISCTNSATKKERDYARSVVDNLIEVYVKCPLSVCQERDVKGYYKLAIEGKIKNFVGIDIKYEEPDDAEIVIETDKEAPEDSINRLMNYLIENRIVMETKEVKITT